MYVVFPFEFQDPQSAPVGDPCDIARLSGLDRCPWMAVLAIAAVKCSYGRCCFERLRNVGYGRIRTTLFQGTGPFRLFVPDEALRQGKYGRRFSDSYLHSA